MATKLIPIPADRAFEQDKPIGLEIIKQKMPEQPFEYGRKYREVWRLPDSHIVDIGLITPPE